MKQLITIGLGTRDRPSMLEEALNSLIDLILPNDIDVKLIVCENGESHKSQKIIADHSEKLPFKVTLLNESKKGIVYMRNRILKEAIESNSTMLAFFDDDEVVDKNWLVNLCKTKTKYSANIVQGHVEQRFPPVDNLELLKEFFPGSFQKSTGDELHDAYTNNVLFDLSLVKEHDLQFDERFNLTGGSDSFFFTQLKRKGARIVFAKEAVVTEAIPASRANIDWVFFRFYRNGYTKYLMDIGRFGKIKAFRIGFRMVRKTILKCVLKRKIMRTTLSRENVLLTKKCMRAKGTFHAMMGVPFSEYNVTHGG